MRVYPSANPVSSFFGISSNCLKWNGQSFESPKHGISPFTPRMHKVTLIRRLCLLPQRPQGTISEFSNLYKPRIMNQTQRESIWCITAIDLWPWMPIDASFVTTNDHSMENTHILASFAKRESLDPIHPCPSVGCKQVAEYVSRLFDWSQSVWQPSAASPGETRSSWWLNQPLWEILVNMGSSSPNRGDNKKYLKPPPRDETNE